jgi:predicted enzyme related to lactoylglutathione lyase
MKNLNRCRINVMVSNMDSAVSYYTETLGLKLIKRYGDHYAEIQAAELMIGLHPASDRTTFGNNISIGLGVFDFDETVKDLESKGIEFTMGTDEWIRLASFTDPDGNALYLAENKSTA